MKFWIDENIESAILTALRAGCPDHELIRVQDTEFSGADDITLLAEAAKQGIVIITHDKRTLINFAYNRVRDGLPMPGVIAVKVTSIGNITNDLIALILIGQPSDFDYRVWYIPFN